MPSLDLFLLGPECAAVRTWAKCIQDAEGNLSAAPIGGDWALYVAVYHSGDSDHKNRLLSNFARLKQAGHWVSFAPTEDLTLKVGVFDGAVPETDPNWVSTLNGFYGHPTETITGFNLATSLFDVVPYGQRSLD